MSRITQGMLARSSLTNLQHSLSRTEQLQERLATGRVLNRPSDSPSGLVTAMQTRSSLARTATHLRSADNAQGWLDQADSALQSASTMTGRVRELVVLGQNASIDQGSRNAIASEIEAIRDGLVDVANTTFAGRPVFAGNGDSGVAYSRDPFAYTGDADVISRTVGDGVTIAVNLTGPEVFGPTGATTFDLLTEIAADLRSGSTTVATDHLGALDGARDRILNALGDIGARSNRLDGIKQRAVALEMNLTQRLSETESVDLPETIMELQMQEVAYQAALSATSRVIQPSLLDFLR